MRTKEVLAIVIAIVLIGLVILGRFIIAVPRPIS